MEEMVATACGKKVGFILTGTVKLTGILNHVANGVAEVNVGEGLLYYVSIDHVIIFKVCDEEG